MITVGQINKLFGNVAPEELSESWDNDGVMLLSNPDKEVKRVLVALEVRMSVVDYAVKNNFDLIVTHHPLIFRPVSRFTDDTYALFEKLFKNNISVLSYHTRLDSAQGGVNDCLANALGLVDIQSFGGEHGVIGRIGKIGKDCGMTVHDFGLHIKKALGCKSIMCACDDDNKIIRTVGLVGGAGKDFAFEAFSMGVDAYVTSEVPHHVMISVLESGKCLYDCGHYYTENPVVEKLQSLIQKEFGVYTEAYDVKSPYFCI